MLMAVMMCSPSLCVDQDWSWGSCSRDGYYLENLFRVQAGDRGFNDFLSRRFPGSAYTERGHDQMRPTSSTSSGRTAG
jgi:hypothetical protein